MDLQGEVRFGTFNILRVAVLLNKCIDGTELLSLVATMCKGGLTTERKVQGFGSALPRGIRALNEQMKEGRRE